MKPVLLALLVSFNAITEAAAQTAGSDHDLTAITGRQTIVVVDDRGRKTQGQLLRFTPDKLLMQVGGGEISVDRRNVAKVFARGDSIVNGMVLGAVGGTALGVLGAITSPTHSGEELAIIPFLTIIGLGVGTAVDALITGKHLVYERAADPDDFSTIAAGRAVIVIDNEGRETRGRILRLNPDELTLMVGGRTRTLAPAGVARVFVPGDSKKNGAMIGLLTGAAIGAASGSQSTCGDFWTGFRPCSVDEKVRLALVAGAFFGGLGAALGAGIDAIIPGRRLVYERPQKATGAVMLLMPAIAASGAGLSMGVSW